MIPSRSAVEKGLSSAHPLIHGTSEMANLIRSHNWAATSIGPIASWPESLRSAVNLMLGCGFPTAIWWQGGVGVQFYNDGYRPFLGAKHPRGLGQRARECWKEAWDLIDEQVESVMHYGQALFFEDRLVPIEIDGVLKDVYWRYSYSPIFGQTGITEGVMVTCQDVTNAYVSSQKVKESAAELRQVLDATNDAVFSLDRNWKFTYFNPKAQKMFDPDHQLLNCILWEAFPDALGEGSPYVEHYHRAMYQGIPGRFDAYYPEPLNAWMEIEACPMKGGMVAFVRDVTDLKRATAALLQNEKLAAVGRLAASIAHEINNPLESVTNLLYLARGSEDPPEIHDYLDVAERELRRVSAITNQTLRFYRQSTNATFVSAGHLFDEVLSMQQGRFVNSHITVEKRLWASRPVECFEGEIRQVLNNLVSNAIDAMHPGGGRLVVRSRDVHRWSTGQFGIALTIADTGHGMTPQVLRKMFEAFYTTKGIGGTGLGLWVSREIVDRHHGALRVRSASKEGQSGSVIVLFLPTEAVSRVSGP